MRIYRKPEYIECWKLSTADIKVWLVDLFEVGDRRVVVKQDAEFGGWEVK